ncbi:nucleoside hydrolase [Kaistia algarum]|uniref:nucleoside hydrolase n=1 Tax=Kaistia algarum TaxID=2083279 RepID=UPI000CE8A8B6|nr:nucleoside hydrolase [Kaistia algarum]MCX5516661.1 nucleoside hydrolase [Kaistia algarum]PPE78564.1 nucleoside hydrolase [Kaistia algarum]
MAKKLILDVDTGTDDAVAIMLAALHPEIELIGVTTVNGNVAVQYCTDNSLRVLDHIGRSDIPVYQGADRPLVRTGHPVINRYDEGGEKYHPEELPIAPARSTKADKTAAEFLIETYRKATDPITLMAVGPLTNVAAALAADPDFVRRVPELIIMGGGYAFGNVTATAEFNIWADAEAAARVLNAGFAKVTLVTLDATHEALMTNADCDRLAALGTPAGQATADIVRFRIGVHDAYQKMGEHGGAAPVHDAVCVAYLVDRAIVSTTPYFVEVETASPLSVGTTYVDTQFRTGGKPNVDLGLHADARGFVEMLAEIFARPHGA